MISKADGKSPGTPAAAKPGAPLLDSRDHATTIVALASACDADPEFARRPTWRGAPAETGALARLQADPLIAELATRSASRVPARFVARLRELALLLAGRAHGLAGAQAIDDCTGMAWVENARGLLIHVVKLDQGRIGSYRLIAPTEWNFHPDGSLAMALSGTHVEDAQAVRSRVIRHVASLDPCVASSVEFDDA